MVIKSIPIGRKLGTPLVALTMATLAYLYAKSSINHAKRNTKLHREADGGSFSWANESERRHGRRESPEEKFRLRDVFREDEKLENSAELTRRLKEERGEEVRRFKERAEANKRGKPDGK